MGWSHVLEYLLLFRPLYALESIPESQVMHLVAQALYRLRQPSSLGCYTECYIYQNNSSQHQMAGLVIAKSTIFLVWLVILLNKHSGTTHTLLLSIPADFLSISYICVQWISQLTDYLCEQHKAIGLCHEGTMRFVWAGAECLWLKSFLGDLSIHASVYLVKSTIWR